MRNWRCKFSKFNEPDRNEFEGIIWVHKNLSHFRLITVSQRPSPDVRKAAAQGIAAKLP